MSSDFTRALLGHGYTAAVEHITQRRSTQRHTSEHTSEQQHPSDFTAGPRVHGPRDSTRRQREDSRDPSDRPPATREPSCRMSPLVSPHRDPESLDMWTREQSAQHQSQHTKSYGYHLGSTHTHTWEHARTKLHSSERVRAKRHQKPHEWASGDTRAIERRTSDEATRHGRALDITLAWLASLIQTRT